MKRADRVAAILLLFFAGFVMILALDLPYWKEFTPGSGFFPLWLGILLAVCSLLLLSGTFSPGADDRRWLPDRQEAIQIGVITVLSIVGPLLAYAIGMVLASAVYMAAVLWYLEPKRTVLNAVVTLSTPVVVWLLFVAWLAVPLPRGPLGF